MIVSGLPIWLVALLAVFITAVYYFRYKKTWMSHPMAILFIFVFTECMRTKSNSKSK